ncbi:MAG: N-formylglutamate amidohydrolase [Rhizobiales bacterium]|nr:N-formylglutamate amidohydrolase [Hyphomicrobiales bacterium]MBI3674812.1 N-formylglutamate amidohydrolase [Hyphomicrobiales bacterium]
MPAGAIVPGNARLDQTERQRRIDRYFLPYHWAITADLDLTPERGMAPLVVSIYSFTASWKGTPRPWHGGILWRDGSEPGIAHAPIEIRQDLIAGKQGVDEWVERLARVIEPLMNGRRGQHGD